MNVLALHFKYKSSCPKMGTIKVNNETQNIFTNTLKCFRSPCLPSQVTKILLNQTHIQNFEGPT